jgi:acyl-coenzyme A synthetase/AMP-(fatty) acid ligase
MRGLHGDEAARDLHWYDAGAQRWIRLEHGVWRGWSARDGARIEAAELDAGWRPWTAELDERREPFYRWFSGGLTNACFNEVDRNVLAGRGEHPAFIFESDRWDAGGRRPEHQESVSYRRLLYETVRAAEVLRGLGLAKGDRVAFNLPNVPQQIFYTEAAKRLGIIYTPVFGGFSAKTLGDRIADSGARVVITADGGYRHGEAVAYKSQYVDEALELNGDLDVETVVVVRVTGQPVRMGGRDRWSHELLREATDAILRAAPSIASESELFDLPDPELWRVLAARIPPVPLDADWPLFIIYTSGSTGKPKGVVHVHGGWLAGLVRTMRVVFDVRPSDRIFTVADPGWITGQSYLIAAPLATGITSIQAEGSPLYPFTTRFASIVERHGATIFKAGSTFLRSVMADARSVDELAGYDLSSLKVATFCAEPVSPAVQEFAMEKICRRYLNSYWATEHGGMVLSRPWAESGDLRPDARTWALPWIAAEVRVARSYDENGRTLDWRRAAVGERGEIVLTEPYPYLARTIWGDAERLGSPDWEGNREAFADVYFSRWPGSPAYTQGDYARRYEDGSFTLHGRSDDVLNVSGHRIGTEEIEGAILRDKTLNLDSPIGNAVVVGAPHAIKGQTPLAFLILVPGREITEDDLRRLDELVRGEKGGLAVPSRYVVVSQFPETRSGKYVRRMLKAILEGEPLGDTSTLRNPEAVDEIRAAVTALREGAR